MSLTAFTPDQLEAFNRDGFLVIEEGFISDAQVERMRARFDAIYRAEYETAIRPDEVNWVAGRDPDDRTRQICNGWKADNALAEQVLSERTGRLAAQLMGYDGVRILQDNCIWKPPGVKALGMHQDGAYLDYLDPSEMITCWIALDDTSAEAGTISFVPGSHKWPVSGKNRGEFHAPPDWLAPARRASFHHHHTFHGSGPNTAATTHRRALISHLLPADARFSGRGVDLAYSRYRKRDTDERDESFFPVVWEAGGGRSAWLDELTAVAASS